MQARIAKTSTLSDLAEWLEQKGWKELPPSSAVLNYCDRLWQKKAGCLLVNLYNYDAFQAGEANIDGELNSFAIELAAQSTDGYWARHEKYGIRGSELKDVLDDQVVKLLKAWQVINEC
ncbi:hypothetical protein D0962_14680 [Leptolyngbyaceae cyanobacterium CCMR0082]|uniref:Uncharacterized protein n=2 Tax=Adonisia turfae TaxID=2950184 RepID=A0A6M0S6B4_9CYAN|nr:hypothetical protein [Adonisia turfae]MDV3348895.1 hypothetical protein [Leptothoe sp. LEGE 181152]NEZ57339.1 hypothetical protein [Adonisia turfae CCMR0081]NEZ64018.1 hypothetical protein [Adonisia turfae CCMR0082]